MRCFGSTACAVRARRGPAITVSELSLIASIVSGRRAGWVGMGKLMVVGLRNWVVRVRRGVRVMRIGERTWAESGLVHRCTVLTLVCLGKLVLHQELVLELLVGARLRIRLRIAQRLCIPGSGSVGVCICCRRVAHHVLSTSSCCGSGEPRSLRSLPDVVVHAVGKRRGSGITV